MSAVSGAGGGAIESTNIMSSKYKGYKTGFMWKSGSRDNASGTLSKGAWSPILTSAFLRKYLRDFCGFPDALQANSGTLLYSG
jgi:hypothetical protein